LRPDYSEFLSAESIDIEFSYNRMDFFTRKTERKIEKVAVQVCYTEGENLLVMVKEAGIYGFGYGPTLPYHFYWLMKDGEVVPVDYEAQN